MRSFKKFISDQKWKAFRKLLEWYCTEELDQWERWHLTPRDAASYEQRQPSDFNLNSTT